MDDIEDFIYRANSKFFSKRKNIFNPLQYLNVKVFGCVRLESDGRFAHLTNDVEAVTLWYGQKHHFSFPYLKDPRLLRTGYIATPTVEPKEQKDFFVKNYEINRGLVIIYCNGSRMYGFIYFPEDAKFKSESLLTNLELIHKFNKYFLHETEADIQRMMAQDFNLKKNKGNLFTEDDKNNPLFRSNQNVNSFFQSISRLTPREEECLQLFQQGYSAQASAAILGISRRTVEHHINHIKEKYKCYSKWELLNK